MSQLEKTALKLGFIPLLDCAPLIVAFELGLFGRFGLQVQLQREQAWASIRDKVAYSLLDGAQMLAPLPFASTLGLGSAPIAMTSALVLSSGGNAITLSSRLLAQLAQLAPAASLAVQLQRYLSQPGYQGLTPRLQLATVYPYSCHHYQLQHWLKACGILPSQIQLRGVPPAFMTSQLAEGQIDGFCVGEPWNSLAQQSGSGRIVHFTADSTPFAQEKVFAVSQQWADQHPLTYRALLSALLLACQWLKDPANKPRCYQWLAQPEYLDLAASGISYHNFYRPEIKQRFFGHAVNQPNQQQARWILQQMQQQNQCASQIQFEQIANVYQPELYQQLVLALGLS